MNYEELLEKARETYESEDTPHVVKAWLLANIIYPADESEDERIRKALIDYFDDAIKSDENPLHGIQTHEVIAWLEKQGEQKQTWKPSAAQLIVIKDLIEDKNTSKVNKTILRGMLDEFTNSHKREIDDAYLQGICDAKHEIEKQGKQTHVELGQSEVTKTSDQELESKKLDAAEVIAWIVANICDFEYYVKLFKKDFGL